MDWVGLKMYEDGVFVLKKILDRMESDVKKMNRLPDYMRKDRTFRLIRDRDHRAIIKREHEVNGTRTMLTLWVADGERVLCEAGPDSAPTQIHPVLLEDSGKVKWRIGGGDMTPLWQLSQSLLDRYVLNA